MHISNRPSHTWLIPLAILLAMSLGTVKATDLNPAAINIKLPKDLTWTENPAGNAE